MKFNVNMEVTDDELMDYASTMLLKVLGAAWRGFDGVFADPQAAVMFQQGIQTGIQTMIGSMQQRQQQQRQRGPVAVPAYPPGYGAVPPGYYPPGPYGPAAAYGPPPGANGPAGPGNVRPIRPEGAEVERCFRIEATRQQEEGVGCCQCATSNSAQRTNCRYCGHPLCHEPTGSPPIVTPPPAPSGVPAS